MKVLSDNTFQILKSVRTSKFQDKLKKICDKIFHEEFCRICLQPYPENAPRFWP